MSTLHDNKGTCEYPSIYKARVTQCKYLWNSSLVYIVDQMEISRQLRHLDYTGRMAVSIGKKGWKSGLTRIVVHATSNVSIRFY